ncbi:MAG: DUF2878 family protein [Myxococcales bacterium]|nr:DUF2878 family protein [Myxococcales bacterium]
MTEALARNLPSATEDKTSRGMSGFVLYPLYIVALAALLTLCDGLSHVRFNVLYYTHPERWSLLAGQPTGEVFIGFLRIAAFCTAAGWTLFRHYPARPIAHALASSLTFVAMYFASGIFKEYPMSLHVAFIVTWAAHLLTFEHDRMRLVLFSVLLGVLGPSFEGYFVELGFFAYNGPHAYHVPVWLGDLYFHGGLAVAATISTVENWRVAGLKQG